jgi:hypothetical protein
MQQLLSKMKIKTGDVFLLWRMKELAAAEKIELNGDTSKSWKDFEVRISAPAEQSIENNQAT